MKRIKLLLFVCGMLVTLSAFAQEDVFNEIADNANVGNGWASVEKYDTSMSKTDLIALGLAELSKEYWENCGPWKTFKTRRASIRKIEKLEKDMDSSTSAPKLKKLYKQKKLAAIVAAESNSRVECTLYWFNIYGTDGSVLRLRYNLGD